MMKLTNKQDAFVKAYLLNGFNATQAAIEAGYSEKTAYSIGNENLSKPEIKKAIEEHQKKSNENFAWSKQKKLEMLERVAIQCSHDSEEKGMLNAQAVIAAIKEHNLMQGDNAPTQTENTHKIIQADDTEW
jgi:phage terminase small subunit